jgi:FKBP-type peptidyl-prolyl cis-trans isomerase
VVLFLVSGVSYVQPGGERQILVPAALAYGEKGVCLPDSKECIVPPNTPVKYDVILKRVAVSPI